MVNHLTVLEVDSVSVGGISPWALKFLPGEHSLVAAGAWELPEGVYQVDGPIVKREVVNRLYFSIWPGRVLVLSGEATGTVNVGFTKTVVTGMRLLLKENGVEVSRYVR